MLDCFVFWHEFTQFSKRWGRYHKLLQKLKKQQQLTGSHSATRTQDNPSHTQCPIFSGVAAEKPTDHALLCHLWQATMHSFIRVFMFTCFTAVHFKMIGWATVTLSQSKQWHCPPQGRHHQLLSDANLPQPSKTWRWIADAHSNAYLTCRAASYNTSRILQACFPSHGTLSMAWLLRSFT